MQKRDSHEQNYLDTITEKEQRIKEFIQSNAYNSDLPLQDQFNFWISFKEIIGNFHNDISFLASLRAKEFLKNKFSDFNLDVGSKPQGAPGLDIDITLSNGKRVIAEIKTTKPYSKGFGAAQKKSIKADILKLENAIADYKYMMVTDDEAFDTLLNPIYFNFQDGIKIIHLWEE